MATIGTLKTLVDWAKELDPDGSTSAVAELLNQTNEVLDTMLWSEGNLPTGERITQRTGLPTSYWRLMNKGVPVSQAKSVQIDEQCGQLTARSEIDKTTAELNGNTNEFRLQESMAHMESMSQEFAQTMFYGSAANPEEFVGLSNRYNDLSAGNAQNILDAGGTGADNSSIWLVGWGPNSVYGIFPKGSTAGLGHENLGLGDAFDSDNNRFRAYMDYYEWNGGIALKDWRFAVRIANVDISDLVGATGTQASTAATAVIKMMTRAIDRLQSLNGVSPSFYANRTVLSHLRVAALDKSNSAVTVEPALNQFGENIFNTRFLGIPVGVSDALTQAEAQVQ